VSARGARLGFGFDIGRIVIVIIVTFLVIICVIPILHVAAVSFSSNSAILASKVSLWPVEFTAESYRAILTDRTMIYSLVYSIVLTVICTLISLSMSVALAYALTKKRLKGRGFFLVMIVITMYFHGGLIPDYLLVKTLGMMNKVWSLILPGAVATYYVLILKTFFADLPESYEESAIIDGANELQVLTRIVLPLSGPVLATIALFYAVGRWNGFLDALFYITNPLLYTVQLKLYYIIVLSTSLDVATAEGSVTPGLLPEAIKAACIVFATIPIIAAYPWLQKYFIKGVMIGGIKG
jgi:putative aldouronate transport system permease protein